MVTLLSKLFIKNCEDIKNPKVREAYGVLCGAVGIFLNVVLFAGKFLAGTISGSIAITADAFNNLSDAGSSFITMIGFKLGGQKPDPEHPFGHGRLEYLSGLAVSVLILLMAYELFKSSLKKVFKPELPESSLLIIAILVASIIVKLYMAFYNSRIAKKIDSAAMAATAKDSLSDTISTAVVLVAIIVGDIFKIPVDGYFGIIVALLIFKTGVESVKDTIGPLLGQAPSEELVEKIEEMVMSHENVLGIHDLVVHDYGPGRVMITLHAEVPYDMNIMDIHDEIDNIEMELRTKLNCEATIHMDPVVTDDEETNAMKKKVGEIISSIDETLKFHDFRMVKGPTHTNLIFDVVAPFKYKYSDDEIKEMIQDAVQAYDSSYFTVILVDHLYVK